ncbi:MAG: ATP-binding protein [Opitutales bacterium]|jgi:PAS domain S-box-containing protein
MLEAEGFEVAAVACNAHQARILADEISPDIVFLDMGISDVETAIFALGAELEIPVVYIAREGSPQPPSPLFIHEPFQPVELSAILRVAMHAAELERQSANDRNRINTLLSVLPEIVIKTDLEGRIIGMNPAAELWTMRSVQKALSKPFAEVVHLVDRRTGQPIRNPADFKQLSDGESKTDLHILKCADGTERLMKSHDALIRDRLGKPVSYIMMLEDVTDSVECFVDRKHLQTALESVEETVIITGPCPADEAPLIKSCNASIEDLSGWNAEELVGKSMSVLLSSPREEFWSAMLDSVRSGHPWRGEGSGKSKPGSEFIGMWSAKVVLDEDGSVLGCVFSIQDRTHMHRLEESIRQSQKIEAVGRLASGIAHDFNNLLSVINSYCDLQILKLEDGSPAMKYAQQIRAAGRKGVDLVSQLMTFSRKDRPNPTMLDLSHVVEDVKGMLRRVIREDIEMETSYEENLASVKADQGQIEQMLLNLCVNARDAMPNGGQLRINVSNRVYEKTVVRNHDSIRQGSYVVLSVEDSGCGMDEETQKRIFDPFFTTKEIGKGTGLGLATVQSIIKQYSGHILVKSRPGEGSRFELIFPAESRMSGRAQFDDSGSSPAPTGNEKIFIVEDDETFLDCISGLLRLHGYQVYTAYDGSSALEMMAQVDYDMDMLVSDLVLPKLSGREVAARMLEHNPDAKVVFMTGYDDQLDTFYALPNDAIILEKPFPLNTLLVKVRELLDQGKKK